MDFAYSFFPVQFTKDGTLFKKSDADALLAGVGTGPNTRPTCSSCATDEITMFRTRPACMQDWPV